MDTTESTRRILAVRGKYVNLPFCCSEGNTEESEMDVPLFYNTVSPFVCSAFVHMLLSVEFSMPTRTKIKFS